MVQRGVPFRVPAAQRELLGAGQAVHADALGRDSHPGEAVEKLLRLEIGGAQFEAAADVLPADVHDPVEPCPVHRSNRQHPRTERRLA